MNSIKCKNCGLSNFPSDAECRRCGSSFRKTNKAKIEKTPSSFSIWSLLPLLVIGAVAYYFYTGTARSIEKVNADDAKRVASQPDERPLLPGASRTEYDRQKTQSYADAVRGSKSLADHNKRVQESEKTMQQISNGQVGK
jgi:hypothetical protein